MYCQYYGLRERPFTLTPNPDFIFLSRGHQEAFAHLSYGIDNRVGFIALTGEVGAGKTTIIRTFLARLTPELHASALIINPMVSSIGLLRAINREFGISEDGEESSQLVDELHSYLISLKEEGKTALLVLDEAQDMEPSTLEQVRLISNLETSSEKLIQIILVGQPELETLLARPELRQLNQRITVRYHLNPLLFEDIGDYLAHRIRISGGGPDKVRFDPGAVRAIHRFAGGLPRLINAVADRALLIGYNHDLRLIDAGIVKQAIADVSASSKPAGKPLSSAFSPAFVYVSITAILISIALAGLFFYNSGKLAASVPEQTQTATVELVLGLSLGNEGALSHFMGLWGMPPDAALQTLPKGLDPALEQAGFSLMEFNGNMGTLSRLSYPAFLEIASTGALGKRYLLFTGMDGYRVIVAGGGQAPYPVSVNDLERYWSGKAIVPWRNFMRLAVGDIPGKDDPGGRSQLAQLLGAAAGTALPNTDDEASLRQAIKKFQSENGLEADGSMSDQTLMQLYRLSGHFRMPELHKPEVLKK